MHISLQIWLITALILFFIDGYCSDVYFIVMFTVPCCLCIVGTLASGIVMMILIRKRADLIQDKTWVIGVSIGV